VGWASGGVSIGRNGVGGGVLQTETGRSPRSPSDKPSSNFRKIYKSEGQLSVDCTAFSYSLVGDWASRVSVPNPPTIGNAIREVSGLYVGGRGRVKKREQNTSRPITE